MRPWGDYELRPRLQAVVGVGPARLRLRAAARDRGRPPQRRRCSAPRASPASTSTPATTTERLSTPGRIGNVAAAVRSVARGSQGPSPGPTRWTDDEERTEDGRPARGPRRPVHGRRRSCGGSTGLVIGLVLGLLFCRRLLLVQRQARDQGGAGEAGRPARSCPRSTRSSRSSRGAADMPMPKIYVSARDAAQRVRDRPQPEPRGGRA